MAVTQATICALVVCVLLALVVPFGHTQDVARAQRGLTRRLERMPAKDVPFGPASNIIRMEQTVVAATSGPTSGPTGPSTGPTSGPTGPTGPSTGPTGPTGPAATPTPAPGEDSPVSSGTPESSANSTHMTPLYSSAYYDSPPHYGGDEWYQHYWFWALVALVFLAITALILACVLKSCLCQKKKSMKYIAPTKTYGTNTPVTDKHRAEMENKYGKFSAY